jgi:hypothetical protein
MARTENWFSRISDATASTGSGVWGWNGQFGSPFFAILDSRISAAPLFKGKRWISELADDAHFPLNNEYFPQ